MTELHKKVVLLQVRAAEDEAERELREVLHATGLSSERIRVVNVLRGGDSVTALNNAAALIIGGSKYSVFEDMPMLDELVELTVETRERGILMFGICFGIQLIAHTFGGQVVRDHENRERGTFDMWLTNDAREDALFTSLPDMFAAQCSHHDQIVRLPEDARLLASSERCRVQAFVMPGRIYGVQFHPERNQAEMERIFLERMHEMSNTNDVISPGGAPLRESPEAASILKKFVEMVV